MKKYIYLDIYDDVQSARIQSVEADGFVVGDPFCQYRMFRYGNPEMIDFVRKTTGFGREIIYQTPVYITDRNFHATVKLIRYLHEEFNVKKILVQDIGLTDYIVKSGLELDIIWGHWGRNRNSMVNYDYIDFLIRSGITAIETNMPGRIVAFSERKLPVYAVYGNTVYNTVSRSCYNSYMLNSFDGICSRECIKESMELRCENLHMTIDGHILGRKYQYPTDEKYFLAVKQHTESVIIYAVNFLEAEKRLRIFDIARKC